MLDQFGEKAPLPAKAGHKAITMFRYGSPSTSAIENLTEGTAPSGTRSLTLSKIEKALTQRGQVVKLTDILTATDNADPGGIALRTGFQIINDGADWFFVIRAGIEFLLPQ